VEFPAETIAEDGNCLYFKGSAHLLHLRAFGIMCCYVLIQGTFVKCMQVFILYEGHITQALTVVDGEVVTKEIEGKERFCFSL
jgi:hypothetical protein